LKYLQAPTGGYRSSPSNSSASACALQTSSALCCVVVLPFILWFGLGFSSFALLLFSFYEEENTKMKNEK
jgi:hypothetical protein